jgi:ribonuclease J
MALVDGREAGIFWQSRMGNNSDGIGGNCHRYDIVSGPAGGPLTHGHFLVDLGIKMGGHGHGYACEFPSPEGLLARYDSGQVDGGGRPPEALFVTHAHEDHLGAIRHAIDMGFDVPPIYCTALTAQLIDKSLVNAGIDSRRRPQVTVVRAGQTVDTAGAKVEFVPMDHLPGATALWIRSDDASVFHTGDYKFDDTLVLGDRADPARLRQIGQQGVDLVVSDSTAVSDSGTKVTEAEIRQTLTGLVADNEGRAVVAGILGTQLDRLASLAQAATANGRSLVVTGRSLVDNLVALRRSGADIDGIVGTPLLLPNEAQDLPADKALVVTTGAFAQPMAGLTRAAERLPGALWIGPDTTVIIPQRPIPPIAHAYAQMVSRLERLGAIVVIPDRAEQAGYGPLHQSGHAIERDAKLLYSLLKPRQLVAPTHGSGKQLEANARLARSLGIDALALDENGAVVRVTRRAATVVGHESLNRIGAAETGQVKHLPRLPAGQGRRPGPVPAYRYDRLDPAGRTVLAKDIGARSEGLPEPGPAKANGRSRLRQGYTR